MSLFSSLNIGMRGLNASQQAIDVTGQNISNANTEGYSRKRLDLQADSRADAVYGELGMGVDVASVQRVRDAFLDSQISEQLGDKGYQTQLNGAMERMEAIIQEPSDNGLNSALNKFWDTWQDLANNPADFSARDGVMAAGNVIVDLLHSLGGKLRDYRTSMDDQLQSRATLINSYTSQIAELNTSIATSEVQPGQVANDSRDKRDLLVRKLSEFVDITYNEDAHHRITVSSGGDILVGPTQSYAIKIDGHTTIQEDGSTQTTIGLQFKDSLKAFNPRGGEIKGLLDTKRVLVPKYEGLLNSLTKTIVQSVNEQHVQGYNLNKSTGVLFFDPDHLTAETVQIGSAIKESINNIAAAAGGLASPQVTLANTIPLALTPNVDLKTINPTYKNLVLGSLQISFAPSGVVLQEGAGKDYITDYTTGVITFTNYANYAPGANIQIKFQNQQNGFPGNGNGQNALNIAQLRQKTTMAPNQAGANTQSINEFYSAMVGTLGIEKNQAATNLQTREFIVSQLDSEQAKVSGVSMDEEMTNMIKFQHSYQASARYISTIKEMLDVLMNIP